MVRTSFVRGIGLTLGAAMLPQPAAVYARVPSPAWAPVTMGREGWLNGAASPASLRGRVVVVDVFTFDCINCKHVVPNLRALHARYGDAVRIVGVHSPETSYERDRENVIENLRAQGITWPVALDSSFAIWRAFGVDAWPTQLVFDREGRLRTTIVGDSQDRELDASIAALLAERPPAERPPAERPPAN